MTKLKYDYTSLVNTIKPSLSNSVISMKNAVNASNISVPSDFKYYSFLTNLDTSLNRHYTHLVELENWLSRSIEKTNQVLEEIENDAKMLDEPIIKEKSNSVIIQ